MDSVLSKTREDNALSGLSALVLVGQVGLVVALPIVGGVIGGIYLDRVIGGGGIILIVTILAGIAVGVIGAFRLLMKAAHWKH